MEAHLIPGYSTAMQATSPIRQRIALSNASDRSTLERLALRFPAVVPPMTRAVLRRSPTSRLRRISVRYLARMIFDAVNRGDHEGALAFVSSPNYEMITPPELASLGFEPRYQGHEGRLHFQLRWVDELGDFQQDNVEVIDLGERLLVLAQMTGSGLSSGAMFDTEIAYLLTVSDGQIIREQSFRSHREGIEAAGLTDGAFDEMQPERPPTKADWRDIVLPAAVAALLAAIAVHVRRRARTYADWHWTAK